MPKLFQGNVRYFETVNVPIKAYLLGFITADGCLQDNGTGSLGLTLTLHSKDSCILEKLRSEIGCEHQVRPIKGAMTHDRSKQKDHCRFQLFNRHLYSDLLAHGLTQRKSTTMPDIIRRLPFEYRKSFILGYFDGDGSASYNIASKQLMVSFRGTEPFLKAISEELNLSKYRLAKDKTRNCWTLAFWRKQDILNFYTIYKELDFYLTRKSERIREFLKISKDETISPS